MSHKIIVCYLRAGSAVLDDHILNRLAKFFAPRYNDGHDHEPVVHVELFFPNQMDDGGLSAGIHYGGNVFLHAKRFSRKHWVFHSIPATKDQIQKAKEFFQVQQGARFNYRGFFGPSMCNISHNTRVTSVKNRKRTQWYCSELVSYALMHAGILTPEDTMVARKHPNASYHVIQKKCNTFMDCARVLDKKDLAL